MSRIALFLLAACATDGQDTATTGAAPTTTCGWPTNDPGTFTSTGADVGDVVANLSFLDQCSDEIQLWDFAEEYHILFITAEW